MTVSAKFFEVWKVLLGAWLSREGPLSAIEIGKRSGASIPTVAAALRHFRQRGEVPDTRNRPIELLAFPQATLREVLVLSNSLRRPVHYRDASGRPADPAGLLQHLRTAAPAGLAVGGVVAGRHYDPDFDLNGLPRLDVLVDSTVPSDWVKKVDPALRVALPTAGSLSSLFIRCEPSPTDGTTSRTMRLADPVETLLDLYEMRLTEQAEHMVARLRGGKVDESATEHEPQDPLRSGRTHLPTELHPHVLVAGSLAAAYHHRDRLIGGVINTKDADVVIQPAGAIAECERAAKLLLANGWRRTDACYPRATRTPTDGSPADEWLRAIRLFPKDSNAFFLELLSFPAAEQRGDQALGTVPPRRWVVWPALLSLHGPDRDRSPSGCERYQLRGAGHDGAGEPSLAPCPATREHHPEAGGRPLHHAVGEGPRSRSRASLAPRRPANFASGATHGEARSRCASRLNTLRSRAARGMGCARFSPTRTPSTRLATP